MQIFTPVRDDFVSVWQSIYTEYILFNIRSGLLLLPEQTYFKSIIQKTERTIKKSKLDGLHLNKQTKGTPVLLISEHETTF